ncbi:MAG: hypothetical protein IPM49_02005 [Flavobacteriales bacterium]|nr:hypothetical protein [Flavobacteriales bacterium]
MALLPTTLFAQVAAAVTRSWSMLAAGLTLLGISPALRAQNYPVPSSPELAFSQGHYPEVFGNDTLRRIGNWAFSTVTGRAYRIGGQEQVEANDVRGSEGIGPNCAIGRDDIKVGRFLSLDPLAAKYPHNSPYAFSENRVVDGRELEGLEYISFHHYADGSVAKTEFYKMTAKDIVRLGGTTAGLHNSVPFGPGGKGVVHQYYNPAGERVGSLWEQRQNGGASDVRFHGLYSGPGCVTASGIPNNEDYNFNEQPIDWADAIAKRHDMDYAAVVAGGEPYAGYLEDIRTVQADRDMVRRIDEVTSAFLGDRPWGEIEGLETPVRTSYSGEMDASMLGQRLVINALATYKQWKIDNGLGNADLYQDNRANFSESHRGTALILDQVAE